MYSKYRLWTLLWRAPSIAWPAQASVPGRRLSKSEWRKLLERVQRKCVRITTKSAWWFTGIRMGFSIWVLASEQIWGSIGTSSARTWEPALQCSHARSSRRGARGAEGLPKFSPLTLSVLLTPPVCFSVVSKFDTLPATWIQWTCFAGRMGRVTQPHRKQGFITHLSTRRGSIQHWNLHAFFFSPLQQLDPVSKWYFQKSCGRKISNGLKQVLG